MTNTKLNSFEGGRVDASHPGKGGHGVSIGKGESWRNSNGLAQLGSNVMNHELSFQQPAYAERNIWG